MTTIWARLTADLGVVETDLKSALGWAESLFKTVVEEEVQLVLPVARQAVASVVADAGALTASGGWLAALEGVGRIVFATLTGQGVSVAGSSVLVAIGTALADAQGSAGSSATAASGATSAGSTASS